MYSEKKFEAQVFKNEPCTIYVLLAYKLYFCLFYFAGMLSLPHLLLLLCNL